MRAVSAELVTAQRALQRVHDRLEVLGFALHGAWHAAGGDINGTFPASLEDLLAEIRQETGDAADDLEQFTQTSAKEVA